MSNELKKFDIVAGQIQAIYENEHGYWLRDRPEYGESYTLSGRDVIKTEVEHGMTQTTVYQDNGAGTYSVAARSYTPLVDNPPIDTVATAVTGGYGPYSPVSQAPSYPLAASDIGRYERRDDSERRDHDDDHDRQEWGSYQTHANNTPYAEEGYRFTIDAEGQVTAVYEVEHGRTEAERIDWNETWQFDGVNVIQTETQYNKVETTLYSDPDQDGLFQQAFELEVRSGVGLRSLETHQFTLADGSGARGDLVGEGDLITATAVAGYRGWRAERVDLNETLQVIELNGDNLILETKTQWNGELDFSLFRDDDNDGLWTRIAEGETRGEFVTPAGELDLVGIADAGLLQPADALVA
jgi:hypothetical protein